VHILLCKNDIAEFCHKKYAEFKLSLYNTTQRQSSQENRHFSHKWIIIQDAQKKVHSMHFFLCRSGALFILLNLFVQTNSDKNA